MDGGCWSSDEDGLNGGARGLIRGVPVVWHMHAEINKNAWATSACREAGSQLENREETSRAGTKFKAQCGAEDGALRSATSWTPPLSWLGSKSGPCVNALFRASVLPYPPTPFKFSPSRNISSIQNQRDARPSNDLQFIYITINSFNVLL